MGEDFSYKKKGEFYILKRNIYPRFRATVNYNTPLPELIDIKFSDDSEAKDMAKALSEMDIYMKRIRKELRR